MVWHSILTPVSLSFDLFWSLQLLFPRHFNRARESSTWFKTETDQARRYEIYILCMLGVLLNLGCPETLDDVHPFLFNLFADSVITILQNNTCLCVFYSLYILFPYFYLAGLTIVEQK